MGGQRFHHCTEEGGGIRVERSGEHGLDLAHLADAAFIEDDDPVGYGAHHRKIVTDKDSSRA